jgi:peptidoglycan/xylan/chitin deacetylase (PgdA/CDA1 family)
MRMKRNYKNVRKRNRGFLCLLFFIIFITSIGIGISVGNRLYSANAAEDVLKEEEIEDRDIKSFDVKETKSNDAKDDNSDAKKDEKTDKVKETKQVVDKKETSTQKSEQNTKNEENANNDIPKGKVAYLTFDDGPSKNVTPQILEILDNYNIKSTFYVIGSLAEKNPDLIRREYASGHTIGNHTYSHNYKYIYGSVDNFISDIGKCESVLKNILGDDFCTQTVRFPGGSFGSKREPYKKALKDKGIAYVDWNALNGDAEGHNIPKDKLVQRLANTTKGKNTVVILMHDAGAKKTTAEALPQVIEYLINEGYQFKAINQEDIYEVQSK